jgi:hypothetical protein
MKKFRIIIYLLIVNFSSVYGQHIGNIKDSDGYTNLREKANSKSRIITSIKLEEEFYYESNNSSNWSKVQFKNFIGYIHNSRIQSIDSITNQISTFYLEYFKTKKSNVELNETYNEKLFKLSKIYPLATITSFCNLESDNQDFLIRQFESPISDMIELKKTYKKLLDYETYCSESNRIINAFEYSAKNIGIELNKELMNYERKLDSISKSYLSSNKITVPDLLELIPKTHNQFSLLYSTTGPDHILYDTNFFYDTTRMIFEQVTTEKNEIFYLPSLMLSSYADGEFAETFIEYLELIIKIDSAKFCNSVKGKKYTNSNPIKYYYELNNCE